MSSILGSAILYWAAAVAIVLAAAAREATSQKLDPWTMYLAGLAGIGSALLFGNGFAVLVSIGHAHEASQGRGAIGALLGAALGAWGVLRLRRAPFLPYADAAAPAVALGYAVYRVGCFLNGCCFGMVTDLPWAVSFAPNTEAFAAQIENGLIGHDATQTLPMHPTQLYHGLLGLAAFVALVRVKSEVPGQRLAAAMMIYGAGRFAIELFRGSVIPVVGPFDANHLAALTMLIGGLWLWRNQTATVAHSKGS